MGEPAPAAPTGPGSPRPITPVGIAAALLEDVERGLDDVAGVPPAVLADLRRARDLTAGLEAYVDRCTSPASAALTALEERTRGEDWRERSAAARSHLEQEMLSGHVEGRLLALLVAISGARRVLEVGMFTGYSALAMAEALPPAGELLACELDPATAALARECFDSSPAGQQISVAVGPAEETLRRLREAGDRFDLVFVDADKTGYAGYVEIVLGDQHGAEGLLAPGGLLCLDNTLLQGEPWVGGTVSANGDAIADLNAALAADDRVEQVLVPLRDGLTLVRRV